MNGYNFTERVRTVLSLARERANRLRHALVYPEDILAAIIEEGNGKAIQALRALGMNPERMRHTIDNMVATGPASAEPDPKLPYSPRIKKVLEYAMSIAREIGDDYVGTEHLLLGLVRQKEGLAAQILVDEALQVKEVGPTGNALFDEILAEIRDIRIENLSDEAVQIWLLRRLRDKGLKASHLRRIFRGEADAEIERFIREVEALSPRT